MFGLIGIERRFMVRLKGLKNCFHFFCVSKGMVSTLWSPMLTTSWIQLLTTWLSLSFRLYQFIFFVIGWFWNFKQTSSAFFWCKNRSGMLKSSLPTLISALKEELLQALTSMHLSFVLRDWSIFDEIVFALVSQLLSPKIVLKNCVLSSSESELTIFTSNQTKHNCDLCCNHFTAVVTSCV